MTDEHDFATHPRTTYRLAHLPIYTDQAGVPYPGRPEVEPGPDATPLEILEYHRAVDRYRDQHYDRVGRAFEKHFRKALQRVDEDT